MLRLRCITVLGHKDSMDARRLFVDDASPVPVYAQLSEQMLGALARGEIESGDRLPSVRVIAAALELNPNTVNRAYAELERIGVWKPGAAWERSFRRRALAARQPFRGSSRSP